MTQAMSFKEAKEKMLRMFPDTYCSVKYEVTMHSSGEQVTDCTIYLDPSISYHGLTFESVFEQLSHHILKDGQKVAEQIETEI